MANDCEILDNKIKQRGLRMTKQRAIILEILTEIKGHLRVEEIYLRVHKRIPHISFGTVYRSLKLLEELGFVKEITFGKHYSLYDSKISPHHHFTCSICEQIMDTDELTPLPVGKIMVDGLYLEVKGFRLDFYGICDKCQEK
jgi:Fe2+ or Zn2+ uptake regulation protein